jgi:tetratricopeptide (TPR) repeat protein
MNCEQVEGAELVEKYVTGRLAESEQADFEVHFLGCRRCFEQVQLWQDMQGALAQHPRRDVRRWAILALAASLLVVAGVSWLRWRPASDRKLAGSAVPSAVSSPARSALNLTALARISPPRYSQPQWRSAGQTGFDLAMQRYSRGDYAGAAPGLLAVVRDDRGNTAAEFFLGISYLMQGRTEDGIAHLKATVALGESPELEEAHFYLAKALLGKQDVSGATAQLRQAIALRGPRQREEQSLLKGIAEVLPTQ